ncbi:hypothetical protein HZB90_01570 [archaeon]|nr:hypothetical protein [archaeon]
MKEKTEKRKKLVDMTPVSRLTYALYIGILVLAATITYFVVAEYYIYSSEQGNNFVSIEVMNNGVDTFADGAHPFLVITATAKEESSTEIDLASAHYRTKYKSEEYMMNYTALMILPDTAYATEFNITATAKTRDGRRYTRITTVKTQEAPDVIFKVG